MTLVFVSRIYVAQKAVIEYSNDVFEIGVDVATDMAPCASGHQQDDETD